jgi:transcriptional regulator with XRE-family HTH domain
MEQLKRLRTERGLSQAKLAARADIDPSTMNQIERGAREPSWSTLKKLADALDVSIAELLEEPTPKAGGRSSLEPSFNDVLEGERRTAIHDLVRDALERQKVKDYQAFARAAESGQPQAYFMRHESAAMRRLLEYPASELVDAYIELMYRCIELEDKLQQAPATTPEEAADKAQGGAA